MIRLMKADLYRLVHTKGIYIVLLAIIAFVSVSVSAEQVGTMGVNSESALKSLYQGSSTWNMAVALTSASFSSSILIYLFIAFFVVVLGYEFSQRTYKNTLTSGVSRVAFVISKYFTQLLTLFVGTFLYYATTAVLAFFKYGTEGIMVGEVLTDALIAMVSLSFCVSVIFSLATLVLLLTTSNIISVVFIIIYPILIQLTYMLTKWDGLKYFDFYSLAQSIGLSQIGGTELVPYILVSLATITISLIGGAIVIRHKEL
ncbi:hypothetical protein E0485_07810 [Paenibacillus albiflavus]|uniref:Uncharacterized protein n=1 Tax=Paenibacillus albiflavus TaxID=2545760 RepID=A0A4R4EGW3_9BACL|nr:ABC transporter permease [Paenibacillus albiflavus]TCZ78400.1 hypothetical protein E0485_07810 [Paenibacillus albiflavus]